MKLSPVLTAFSISDILLFIFSYRILHYDPNLEAIYPLKQLGLVNKSWGKLVRSAALDEAIRCSSGFCFRNLHFGTKSITGSEHVSMLKNALDLDSLTPFQLGTLLAKCEDKSTIQVAAGKLAYFGELTTDEKDFAFGQILQHYSDGCVASGEIRAFPRFTEYFRASSVMSSVWAVISGDLRRPYDFSKYEGISEAARNFLRSSDFDSEECIRIPAKLLAKLWIIESFSENSNSVVYQSIAIEKIRLFSTTDRGEDFVNFVEFFDSMTLCSGLPMDASVLFVPLAFAAMSDLGNFFAFISSTKFDLETMVKRLETAGLESNSIECINLASSFRVIVRLLQGDLATNPASLCFMPSIKELQGYGRLVFRFHFNIVQFRMVVTAAESMGLSGDQKELMNSIFSAAYYPFKLYT